MIGAIIDALAGPLGTLVAGVAAVFGVWLAGRRAGQLKRENDALRANKATWERITNATENHVGDDPGAFRDFLRERGER